MVPSNLYCVQYKRLVHCIRSSVRIVFGFYAYSAYTPTNQNRTYRSHFRSHFYLGPCSWLPCELSDSHTRQATCNSSNKPSVNIMPDASPTDPRNKHIENLFYSMLLWTLHARCKQYVGSTSSSSTTPRQPNEVQAQPQRQGVSGTNGSPKPSSRSSSSSVQSSTIRRDDRSPRRPTRTSRTHSRSPRRRAH